MGAKKVFVHEIVVNWRIPPYKESSFKEDDEISIDTCLLFVPFQEKVHYVKLPSLWRSTFKFECRHSFCE